ncbi:MAG: hypothetical protein ACK40M_00390 [Flavobacteriales bacterium]
MKRFVLLSFFLGLLITGIVLVFALPASSRKKETIQSPERPDTLNWSRECPPEGSAKTERIRELNRLKNRISFPQAQDFDTLATMKALLLPGNDEARWNEKKAARVRAYVVDVKPGGKETCNCGAKEVDDRDTHIDLVMDPMNEVKSKRFIAEVTPPMRSIMKLRGENWTTRGLRDQFLGRWVEVEGWLFLDEEHLNTSENTRPLRENNWRATAWEIHPVTSIKVINRPR